MDGTEDQVAANIVEAFKALKSVQARRTAYCGILGQLRSNEWRDVAIRAKEMSFHYDILGSLPLEIVAQIVKYLDPWEILRFQRVSTRWQQLLSSNVIYTAVLKKYRIFQERTVCESLFVRYAKCRFALEFGRPYHKAVYPVEKSAYLYPQSPTAAYRHRQVAWAESDGERRSLGVIVRCLQSGRVCRFVPPNRGSISNVLLSESNLAVITFEGYCTVWGLSTELRRSFRLPSADIRHISFDGDRIAITSHVKNPSLLVLNLTTGTTRSIPIQKHPLIMGFHPGEDRLVMLFLEENKDPSAQSKIVRVRYSCSGETISPLEEPQISLTVPDNRHIIIPYWRYGSKIAGDSVAEATTGVVRFIEPSTQSCQKHHVLLYYPETDELLFRLSTDDVEGPWSRMDEQLLTSDGVVYFVKGSMSSPLETAEISIYKLGSPPSDGKVECMQPQQCELRSCFVFGDAELFGILSRDHIQVWSFDPNLDLHNGHPLQEQSKQQD